MSLGFPSWHFLICLSEMYGLMEFRIKLLGGNLKGWQIEKNMKVLLDKSSTKTGVLDIRNGGWKFREAWKSWKSRASDL